MAPEPTYATVHNEGCDLHYWYLGTGPLITFIPGGNGHGRQYNLLMTALSPDYTCVTFDRRQMSASRVSTQKTMSPPQQARDVAAVINAVVGPGEKSIVFGSSLGGLIGLQLARDNPAIIEHLICHEPPAISLLPDASEVIHWLVGVYDTYKSGGAGVQQAFAEFEKGFAGMKDEGVPRTAEPEEWNAINFFENEFLTAGLALPDLRRVRGNGVSIGLMNGERSGDAFYARATIELEKVLECVRMVVPGHHQGFEVEVEAFLPKFLEMVKMLEEKTERRAEAEG